MVNQRNARSPRQAVRRPSRGAIGSPAWLVLAALLVLPGLFLQRIAAVADWRLLLGGASAVSLFSFFSLRSDKQRAEAGEWRIPEATLHLAEMIGGWPGAFLAQRLFRHKIAKASYQVVFWAIVMTHQFVALDALLEWRLTKGMAGFIKTLV